MDPNEISKTVAYSDGHLLNKTTIMNALLEYWGMGIAEKRSFRIMLDKYPECPKDMEQFLNNREQHGTR